MESRIKINLDEEVSTAQNRFRISVFNVKNPYLKLPKIGII